MKTMTYTESRARYAEVLRKRPPPARIDRTSPRW